MTNLRTAVKYASGQPPGPEGSITKLFRSRLAQRIASAAADLLGPAATAWLKDDDTTATVVRALLNSPASTIAGGTSDIQRNIIGERVLGLPKEPDLDRGVSWKDIPRSS